KLANRANDYLIDRDKQRSNAVYSGIDFGAHVQDAAVTETVGSPTVDRSREHLGIADAQIAALRQFELKAIHDLAEGIDPPLAGPNPEPGILDDFYLVNAVHKNGEAWKLASSNTR